MAIVNEQLKNNTYTTILTVPAGKSYAITNILVCNNGPTASVDFDMHLVPQGAPTSNYDTRVINNLTLPAGETFTFDNEKIVLSAGDQIIFFADPPFTFPTANANTAIVGKDYEIITSGTTDYTAIGSLNNTVGTIFTATGAGTGTGTITLSQYTTLAATVSYLEV